MLIRFSVFALALAALTGTSSAPAATPCDWEATHRRNDHEALCYKALGPKNKDFSYTDAHQDKLEKCLVRVKRNHRFERMQCAQAAKAVDTKKP